MHLRQQVARAEIEEKPGEERELEAEHAWRDIEHPRDERAGHRRHGVDHQQRAGAQRAVSCRQHEGDRIESVREVVRHDGQQHDHADARPGLESDADGQSVEEAVEREPDRADQPDVMGVSRRIVLFLAVDDGQFLEQEDGHEAGDERRHQPPDRHRFMQRDLRHLGNEIEKSDADQQSRGEGHDVQQVALVAERERAAGESHRERG